MTKAEIQAVIFIAASMLAGAVILLVKQYDSDILPDLGPAPAHGRLNAGIETEPAAAAGVVSSEGPAAGRPDSGGPSAVIASRSASSAGDLLVPVNTAPASELQKLPGIGPKLAERIVAYRRQSGHFKRVEQLLEVKGIGPAKLGRLRPFVEIR